MMKHVVIAGAGRSGRAAYRLVSERCTSVLLLDDVSKNDVDGPISWENVKGAGTLVLSPGIPRSHPTIQSALSMGIPVINEIDLAMQFLPPCSIVGITGTNGKSTTTTMLGAIVRHVDPQAIVGGNLGIPLCAAVLDHPNPRYVVLELSSYQLESLSQLKLDVAVVTNLSPDHMDRYSNEQAYYDAKNLIFSLLKTNGTAVINRNDANSQRFLHIPAKVQTHYFSADDAQLNSPYILGHHNQENAAAAMLAASALGLSQTQIRDGIAQYTGIAHRMERLGNINGVTFVNDSKATNEQAACVALQSFNSCVHLVAGGLGKGSDYSALLQLSAGRVKCVYAIGQDAHKIQGIFSKEIPVHMAETLENAVNLAFQQAKPGDTILLSPACASLDQFRDFEHRGNVFRACFERLQET